ENYGKFSKVKYPYLFWEPSDQQVILDVANEYNKGPTHSLGFRFAINIDPIMFEVFASAASGTNLNINLTDATPGSNHQHTIITSITKNGERIFLVFFVENNNNHVILFNVTQY